MTRRSNIELILTMAGLVLLSISPGYTQGKDQINLLLCGAMCLSPLVLLLGNARVLIPRIDVPLASVCILVLVTPLVFHPETIRLSTMLFTCAYCCYMMMLARTLRVSGLDAGIYLSLIRGIVYAFAIVLLVQQACVLLGWPVFCPGMVYENPFKLNSLTAEPSHTTVTLTALMFFFTQTVRVKEPGRNLWTCLRTDWLLWAAWLWVLFSTFNASAYALAPLPLLPFLTRHNALWYLAAAVAAAALIFFTPVGNMEQLARVRDTARAMATLDENAIIEADGNAAFRTVPTIRGFKALWPLGKSTLTGHGVDADQHELEERPNDSKSLGFAGHFSMFYNYGALCALALWWAIGVTTLVPRRPWSILTFLFALQMSADYNMQLLWLLMGFGMTFKYAVCNDRLLLSTIKK